MIFSDVGIRACMDEGRIDIDPFMGTIQPASYDVHLGPEVLKPEEQEESVELFNRRDVSDVTSETEIPEGYKYHDMTMSGNYMLSPGEFILASTHETVALANDIAARLCGRSTMGRSGLVVHMTAGFIDPGFSGEITLEMSNLSNRPVEIEPEMRLAQLVFYNLDQPCEESYGEKKDSKYQNQQGPTPSKPDDERGGV